MLTFVDLARDCLTYLTFDVFETGPCQDVRSLIEGLETHRFSDYAVRFWGAYVRGIGERDPKVKSLLCRLLSSNQILRSLRQVQLYDNEMIDSLDHSFWLIALGGWTPLHFLAQVGLAEFCANLVVSVAGESAPTINTSNVQQALHEHGIVQSFCQGINSCDFSGLTPIHICAQHGHEEMLKFLLSQKANAALQNEFGTTPVHVAAQNGHSAILQLLREAMPM